MTTVINTSTHPQLEIDTHIVKPHIFVTHTYICKYVHNFGCILLIVLFKSQMTLISQLGLHVTLPRKSMVNKHHSV